MCPVESETKKKGLELLSLPTWVLVTKHGSQEQYLLLTADKSLQPYFQIFRYVAE